MMPTVNDGDASRQQRDPLLDINIGKNKEKGWHDNDGGEFPALFCHEGDCTLG